jgi:hypothetical protein
LLTEKNKKNERSTLAEIAATLTSNIIEVISVIERIEGLLLNKYGLKRLRAKSNYYSTEREQNNFLN